MTKEFYHQYLTERALQQREKLHAMNPKKFHACEYLVRKHEQRGDKVLCVCVCVCVFQGVG